MITVVIITKKIGNNKPFTLLLGHSLKGGNLINHNHQLKDTRLRGYDYTFLGHSGLDPESPSQSEEILNQVQDYRIKVHNTIGLTISRRSCTSTTLSSQFRITVTAW